METYDTVTEAITDLKAKGYTTDFNLKSDALVCATTATVVHAKDFVVDAMYRFEGMTDPADETILYAISAASKNMKGLLINAYGIYSDELADEMMAKLK